MYRDFKSEEKLIDALNIYQEKWVESLPDDSELEHITFSKKFENKIHKLLTNEEKEHKEGGVVYFSTTFKRVTSLLLASVMFVVVVLFGVTALRETLFGFLKEYNSNDTATVIYPLDDPSYNPYIAFEEGHFAYIPTGFERTTYNYSTHFFHQEYTNEDGNYIQIHQEQVGGGVLILDTENCEIIKLDLFGSNAFYYEKNGNHLYWQHGSSYYLMISDIPIEEMLKIARSLY